MYWEDCWIAHQIPEPLQYIPGGRLQRSVRTPEEQIALAEKLYAVCQGMIGKAVAKFIPVEWKWEGQHKDYNALTEVYHQLPRGCTLKDCEALCRANILAKKESQAAAKEQ